MKQHQRGFTLIEMLFSASICVSILGTSYFLFLQLQDTRDRMQMRSAARSEMERVLYTVEQELGQAAFSSIALIPGGIRYRVVADVDGDGTALNGAGQVEQSEERIIVRDLADMNQDGLGAEQLVLVSGGRARVLANGLAPDQAGEGDAAVPGVRFETTPPCVRVALRMQQMRIPDRCTVVEEAVKTIFVRNP